MKVRDADRRAVGVSVRGRKIQSCEDDGVGGAAQLAFEFQHDALLRDVKRKGFARLDFPVTLGLNDIFTILVIPLGRE